MPEEKREAIEVLEKQIEEKVIPFCKDNEVPLVMATDKTTYLLGTDTDMKDSLYNIIRGMITKGVIDEVEIQAMLAHIRSKTEKKEGAENIAADLTKAVHKFTDEINEVAHKYERDFAKLLKKVLDNLNKAYELMENGGEV